MERIESFLEVVKRKNWVILDTETTGLRPPAEIVQIGIINADGYVLLDCLIKPVRPIPQEAINIHGISNELAAAGLAWSFVSPLVRACLKGKDLIIYNAGYDTMILDSTDNAHRVAPTLDDDQVSIARCWLTLIFTANGMIITVTIAGSV